MHETDIFVTFYNHEGLEVGGILHNHEKKLLQKNSFISGFIAFNP